MLLSCDIVISICSNLFPYTLIGSGLFEVFNLEGEPDHQDSEGDRKDSDQPYQSQRAATRACWRSLSTRLKGASGFSTKLAAKAIQPGIDHRRNQCARQI
jgi:hypothetical protein